MVGRVFLFFLFSRWLVWVVRDVAVVVGWRV